MNKQNLGIGLAVVAIILAIIAFQYPKAAQGILGAITGETNFNTIGLSGLKLGSSCNDSFGSGSCQTHAKFLSGTCNALIGDQRLPVAATSSFPLDCAVTGAVSGDKFVSLYLPTTANNVAAGKTDYFVILNSYSSSTSGFITANVLWLGASATNSFAQASTTLKYWIAN